MKKTTLKLDGLSCQHCIMALTKEFKSNTHIHNVDVQLKQADIEHDDGISDEELIQIVSEAGYGASL